MNKMYRQVLEDLIRLRTTADRPDELSRAVEYVAAYFAGSNAVVRRYESGGKPSVVVSTRETLEPETLLMGHLDVVPAPEAMFEPAYDGPTLRARGACDMKAEIAVMMELMRDALARPNPPDLALMLTTDEEIGGAHGAGYLVDTIGYRAKAALIPDGGESPDDVIVRNKGILQVRLSAVGVAAHGSRPWLGENAIDTLIDSVRRVQALFPANDDPEHWHVTCTLGIVHGGTAANAVPDAAEAVLDIRFPETTSADALLARIREAAAPAAVEVRAQGNASLTPPEAPALARYASLVREQFGAETRFGQSHGGNDGRYLTARGIPVIVSRPRSGGQHGPEEWIDLESLEAFRRLYASYLGL